MSGPAVTVVMPTRDRGWVLPRAVRSVLGQVAGDLELVVVDDGSVDGTAALLDRIDDPRLVRVRTDGVGSAAARNAGVAAGSAPLLAFLDDDNTWSPDFLEVMRAERGDAVLAYCSQHVFLCRREPGDEIAVLSRSVRSTPYNPVAFVRGSHVDTSSLLMTRAVFDAVGGFDPGLRRLVDWDLVAGVVARHPFQVRHVDQVLCDYYLFLAEGGAPTITNRAIDDGRLLEHAGLAQDDPDTARIRAKLRAVLPGPQARA
jgi:glycosyltransferase involved in cell wall biosynthesis